MSAKDNWARFWRDQRRSNRMTEFIKALVDRSPVDSGSDVDEYRVCAYMTGLLVQDGRVDDPRIYVMFTLEGMEWDLVQERENGTWGGMSTSDQNLHTLLLRRVRRAKRQLRELSAGDSGSGAGPSE